MFENEPYIRKKSILPSGIGPTRIVPMYIGSVSGFRVDGFHMETEFFLYAVILLTLSTRAARFLSLKRYLHIGQLINYNILYSSVYRVKNIADYRIFEIRLPGWI